MRQQTIDTYTSDIGTPISISKFYNSRRTSDNNVSALIRPEHNQSMITPIEEESKEFQTERTENQNESYNSEEDKTNESVSEEECDCKPVLIADDNDFNLFTFKQVLKDMFNLDSSGACNGLEAVKMVKESLQCCPFRAVFMDCSMPIMNGYEATRKILELFDMWWQEEVVDRGLKEGDFYPGTNKEVIDVRKIPIAALTANDTVQERKRCMQAGMSVFLSKPPEPQELKKFVKSVFEDNNNILSETESE